MLTTATVNGAFVQPAGQPLPGAGTDGGGNRASLFEQVSNHGASDETRCAEHDAVGHALLLTRPVYIHNGNDNLVNALAADARRTAADLVMATGLSETAVRRRITEMTRSGHVLLRCDFAQSAAGWRVSVSFRAQLPAAQVDALGAALAERPEIRLCAAISDTENNILLIEWLSALQDCVHAEALLTRRFPELRINERNVTLRPLKRMGRLLSRTGAAVGYVPPSVWV